LRKQPKPEFLYTSFRQRRPGQTIAEERQRCALGHGFNVGGDLDARQAGRQAEQTRKIGGEILDTPVSTIDSSSRSSMSGASVSTLPAATAQGEPAQYKASGIAFHQAAPVWRARCRCYGKITQVSSVGIAAMASTLRS